MAWFTAEIMELDTCPWKEKTQRKLGMIFKVFFKMIVVIVMFYQFDDRSWVGLFCCCAVGRCTKRRNSGLDVRAGIATGSECVRYVYRYDTNVSLRSTIRTSKVKSTMNDETMNVLVIVVKINVEIIQLQLDRCHRVYFYTCTFLCFRADQLFIISIFRFPRFWMNLAALM